MAKELPESRPAYMTSLAERSRIETIPLSALIIQDCPPPDAKLRASIKLWGLFEMPIVKPYRQKWKVIAGSRRCRALSLLSMDDGIESTEVFVHCLVIEDAERALAAMAMTNNMRKANPLTDLLSIREKRKQLTRKGIVIEREVEKVIYKELGFTAATQRKRLKLDSLHADFLEAIIERRLPLSAAERIASLSDEKREELRLLLEDQGSLKLNDVKQASKAQTLKFSQLLPWNQITAAPELAAPSPKENIDAQL